LIAEEIELPPLPSDSFFYAGRGGYAMRRADGRFIPLPPEGAVRQHLAEMGVARGDITGVVCRIREDNYVSYIGPMAGYPSGIHDGINGYQILVTYGPRIIPAVAGDFPVINSIMRGLFEDPEHPDQFHCVLAWLRKSRANVLAAKRRPTPALALVGRRGAGKSLAIELFKRALGGRAVNAYRSLCGDSAFNLQLAGAELLTIDDVVASRDHRARVRLAQAIKATLFAGAVTFEGKGRDAFDAAPVQSLIIAVNDEPQHVQVLPELDENIRDKIALVKVGEAVLSPDLAEDPDLLSAAIDSEMAAFLHWLESSETPDHLVDRRGRLIPFWHPAVLAMIDGISPENRLAELLAQATKITAEIDSEGSWRGTAADVEATLLETSTTRHAARTLLSLSGATGTFLSRLCEIRPATFSKSGHKGGVQTYRITEGEEVVVE
jgi:hypothetical protein